MRNIIGNARMELLLSSCTGKKYLMQIVFVSLLSRANFLDPQISVFIPNRKYNLNPMQKLLTKYLLYLCVSLKSQEFLVLIKRKNIIIFLCKNNQVNKHPDFIQKNVSETNLQNYYFNKTFFLNGSLKKKLLHVNLD